MGFIGRTIRASGCSTEGLYGAECLDYINARGRRIRSAAHR
jgi:hypothetical protein